MSLALREEILSAVEGKIRVMAVTGDNASCACPFHKGGLESRPSFYIYLGPVYGNKVPGMAFCHTCNRGWSLKSLLFELGLPRKKIDLITKDLPVEQVKKTAVQYARALSFKNPILPEALLGVYDHCPTKLLRSGFEMRTLRNFEVGFDNNLHRITFPLRDHLGNLVGISGRTPNPDITPRYHLYKGEDLRRAGNEDKELQRACSGYKLFKGRFVWNLHRLYPVAMLGTVPYVVVVEGFKQAMWVAQAGLPNVVATMGSHVSKEQAALLLRLGTTVLLFFDNDDPGQESSKKTLKWLRRQTPNVYEMAYPKGTEGKSPDDLEPELLQAIFKETV